jgi:hypothetical protein
MSLRILIVVAAVALAGGWRAAAAAEWLYVTTVASPIGMAPSQGGSHLYKVELPNGKAKPIGTIRAGGMPIAVTGLANQPITGTLYGITAEDSPNHPRALVTIDPKDATATLVGNLGLAGSDIAFDKHGMLYVWLRETSQVGTVSLKTGEARPVGPTKAATEPGGIAIDDSGRVYVVPSGATGSLDQIDSVTGRARKGPTLQGAPYAAGINALSITADGRIYAVNSNRGVPAKSALITIDPVSGEIRKVGELPDDADALVQFETPWSMGEFLSSTTGVSVVAGILVLIVVLVLMLRMGRRPRA